MGGLIIRAALPYLKEYQHIMNSFISIGTPHIGCLSNNSLLIDAGREEERKFESCLVNLYGLFL